MIFCISSSFAVTAAAAAAAAFVTNRPPTLEIFPSWPMRFQQIPRVCLVLMVMVLFSFDLEFSYIWFVFLLPLVGLKLPSLLSIEIVLRELHCQQRALIQDQPKIQFPSWDQTPQLAKRPHQTNPLSNNSSNNYKNSKR